MAANPLDLPLLRAFVAIYETGSVTAAAERLFVTQPTVSYSLGKLRDALNDPLFVRSGSSMVPTPRAQDCYEPFSGALLQIENALERARQFEPAESRRRFRVAMSDIGELIFLPPIFKLLQARASHVELEVVQVATEDLPGWLASGKVDAAVGNLPSIRSQTRNARLFHEHYVCLLSRHHPRVRDQLGLEEYLSERHVYVSSKFSGHRQVEEALREAGVLRQVALQVPHFTVLPHLISTSELLAVVPSRVAATFESYGPLSSLALPIAIAPIEVMVHWDRRHEGNAAQQWFIAMIREALQHL
jgi:DNA-binding transcriptional LysR family regulator